MSQRPVSEVTLIAFQLQRARQGLPVNEVNNADHKDGTDLLNKDLYNITSDLNGQMGFGVTLPQPIESLPSDLKVLCMTLGVSWPATS